MNRRPCAARTALVLGAILSISTILLVPGAYAGPEHRGAERQRDTLTFAVIGDVPYGTEAEAHFPTFIRGINADPDVTQVTHLGDFKSGSTTCTDERFAAARRNFDLFADPLYYTPGDNEWTDCHRATNGGYQPFERLAKVRSLFFAPTGRTLGHPVPVRSQAERGIPENFRWERGDVSFATIHVVGSNDDLAPWTGTTAPTQQQIDEERHRMSAAVANVKAAFHEARDDHRRAVVIQQQADMFDSTVATPQFSDYSAFKPLVQTLIDESRRFRGATYLFNGDSHEFREDNPLAQGSRWLSFYGVRGSSDDLRRVTVDGSGKGELDWLKVTVHENGPEVLSVEQVPGQ